MKPRKPASKRSESRSTGVTPLVPLTEVGPVTTNSVTGSANAGRLPPPHGYRSWLDYAVQTMNTRELELDHSLAAHPLWPNEITREHFKRAALDELTELREASLRLGKER